MTRRSMFVAALAVVALSVSAGAGVAATGPAAVVDGEFAHAIADQINAVRSSVGLRPLALATGLARAARQHDLSMAHLGYFSHSSADGSGPTRRIASFYSSRGATSWAVGEVIAWSTGSSSAEQVVGMWLASDFHRRELLRRAWREIGVAVVHAAHAPGVYGGRDVTIVVVDFGRRS